MSNTVLVGAQWGDEGKGKIIDVLTADAQWVVRYQGGSNAGHTIEIGERKYVLHLVPSGILRETCNCVIGNGLVVDIISLADELQALAKCGIRSDGRLFISDRAHIAFPYHRALENAKEDRAERGRKIGSTGRGIGPAYADKADRTGLRLSSLLELDFPDMVREQAVQKNDLLAGMGAQKLDIEPLILPLQRAADYLRPFICDTVPLLHEAVCKNESILFEGAQGMMLDVDFGTYPFVTSSSTGTAGASAGSGIPLHAIDRVVGVIKAYTTRVGEGPFPTELKDAAGRNLARIGREFGATTGRPRRCGWFDGVIARYAAMVCGINEWALMKLDVLDTVESIKVCRAYEIDGEHIAHVPSDIRKLMRCKPVYEELKGWNCPTTECVKWEELPKQARKYVEYIEELTGVKVRILSLGPKRSNTLLLDRRSE